MINTLRFCQAPDRQANPCAGCENCRKPGSENKLTDTLPLTALYAAEAHTYYLYSQHWFHPEVQDNRL